MIRRAAQSALVVIASSLLFACAGGEKVELKVKAVMNGRPAGQARVTVDAEELGVTDENGLFAKVLKKKPGAEVEVVVSKEVPGYHIKPWKGSFLMKLPQAGAENTHSVDADLVARLYLTLVVTEKGAPVPGAAVRAHGKEVGKTDAKGEFIYEYKDLPKTGLELTVSKQGYAGWRKTGAVEPGQRLEAALTKRLVVTISAMQDEFGQASGIPGLAVSVNNKPAGKTDPAGVLTWSYDGDPGKKVQILLSAPGYLPDSWNTTLTLTGDVRVQRSFTPLAPRPVRTGFYRFGGNTPNTDLTDVLAQAEAAVAAQFFKNSCFREVPSKTLESEMKLAKVTIDKITTTGWSGTPLKKTVDMIVLGSVAQDEKGYLIEAKLYTAGGRLILSQLARAKNAANINSAAKEITTAVLEQFPFEGAIVGIDNERYRINLGKSGYRIAKGTDFMIMAPNVDATGKVSGYRETGRLRVKKSEDKGSWTEAEDLNKDEQIAAGDRVVRRFYREGEQEAERKYFILSAKGGLPPDVSPLAGVNIYINDMWLGSTGPDGKAEVPVRLNKNLTLVLYRHGYQQATQKIQIDNNKDTKEFTLLANNAVFKVDSVPQSADVYVDADKLGKTPLLDGKPVNLGFHTVKVALGGDYRDWEEVLEFSKKEENRTGGAKIILHKDYLRIGERAEHKGDLDGAILAYKSAVKGHPDFSAAHHRLARIYLDDKSDYDGAIREFESVLSLPENQQLVFKQFSVAFMNLGHAYYEKGNSLIQANRETAATHFGKAIQNFQIAKQNMRFFPNDRYDEAVHDMYYYTALSYHKLYQVTRKNSLLGSANLAWREYFDFFPRKLEGKAAFDQARESAEKYWGQIKNL